MQSLSRYFAPHAIPAKAMNKRRILALVANTLLFNGCRRTAQRCSVRFFLSVVFQAISTWILLSLCFSSLESTVKLMILEQCRNHRSLHKLLILGSRMGCLWRKIALISLNLTAPWKALSVISASRSMMPWPSPNRRKSDLDVSTGSSGCSHLARRLIIVDIVVELR